MARGLVALRVNWACRYDTIANIVGYCPCVPANKAVSTREQSDHTPILTHISLWFGDTLEE